MISEVCSSVPLSCDDEYSAGVGWRQEGTTGGDGDKEWWAVSRADTEPPTQFPNSRHKPRGASLYRTYFNAPACRRMHP
jgi:hypothetical protein